MKVRLAKYDSLLPHRHINGYVCSPQYDIPKHLWKLYDAALQVAEDLGAEISDMMDDQDAERVLNRQRIIDMQKKGKSGRKKKQATVTA
jgi:hypothetical protein